MPSRSRRSRGAAPTAGRRRGGGPVVLKRVGRLRSSGTGRTEAGFRIAAHARGRGIAPRALEVPGGWAFADFAGGGLRRLERLRQSDNTASCHVARKCRFEPVGRVPAAHRRFPLDGRLPTRELGGRGTTAETTPPSSPRRDPARHPAQKKPGSGARGGWAPEPGPGKSRRRGGCASGRGSRGGGRVGLDVPGEVRSARWGVMRQR
ncbi:GNAT family N-acetyltransferase [Streptomyces sp. KHY 26]|uniref:GNAT family N-acetyltransferase n=1 Tax=Streptomyces sp. KHY 26 TaxID=3097359 RepID=UPI00376EF28C